MKHSHQNHPNPNWIAKATGNKGGLHKSLGVPVGKTIPAPKVNSAVAGNYGPKAKKQALLAKTLKGLNKGK